MLGISGGYCGGEAVKRCFMITFRRKGEVDDSLIVLEGGWKLLWWFVTTGIRCRGCMILEVRNEA